MQINLNETEITEAVDAYVRTQIAIKGNQNISVEFTAGRGANGLTAALEITSAGLTQTPPQSLVKRSVETVVAADPEPVQADPVTKPEPAAATKPIFGKAKTAAAAEKAPAPEPEDETETDAVEDETEAGVEADAPAPSKSIFAKKKVA